MACGHFETGGDDALCFFAVLEMLSGDFLKVVGVMDLLLEDDLQNGNQNHLYIYNVKKNKKNFNIYI